jgi:anti-sigma factor RsiW
MCDFSGRLVAWMDRELPDNDGADVERHIRDCSECRKRVDAYEEVSRAFVAHCNAAMEQATSRRLPRWVPVLASAAATVAVLFLVFQPAPITVTPVRQPVADTSPAIVLEAVPKHVKRVHHRRGIAPVKTTNANWALSEPAIQIAIPVEAMFPPGAVPEGITFIADVSIAADGSVQGLRLQP